MRLLPRTLRARLALLLFATLLAAQALTVWILADERRLALLTARREQLVERTLGLARLLHEVPWELEARVLEAASSRGLVFLITRAPLVAEEDGGDLAGELVDAFGLPPGTVRVALLEPDGSLLERLPRGARPRPPATLRWKEAERENRWPGPGDELLPWTLPEVDDPWLEDFGARPPEDAASHTRLVEMGRQLWRESAWAMAVSVDLGDGRWLDAVLGIPRLPPLFGPSLLLGVAASALVAGMAWSALRTLTRPLADLAAAAEAFGRGLPVPELGARGPEEIRRALSAFDRMRARIERLLADRQQTLAALAHDLRTPLTSLRLRAEFVDDEETRQRILEAVEEIQRLTESALALLRAEADREPPREVDLRALVESVAEDLADLGGDVEVAPGPPVRVQARLDPLRRALRNLVENAVRYGRRARIRIEADRTEVRVVIEDEGPGIPEDMLERVFEPFVRLEASRSRETGGSGLGLAIARTVARAHGGDVRLENRREGGLRAILLLPR
ncbi:Osmolarity sensor protein EnvZ [bacterium HR39]|nr:Osmolarity sensor protein EnvZ [bacterium HR39]